MDSEVVKELISKIATHNSLTAELELIVNNKDNREKMLANYQKLHDKMGKPGHH